jgi:threonine dehydratase
MTEPAVTPDDIAAARRRTAGHLRRTPVVAIEPGELGLPFAAHLKLELLQHTGSFKPRGAFNRILAAQEAGEVPAAGLIAASGGNHGAAVAFAAARLGLPAEVFVPSSSPALKRDRIASFGATVHVVEGLYDDAQAASDERRSVSGALAVHPYDHPEVVAGQGTLAAELDEQVDGYDTLVVATGGGGFTAGQAAWVRDRVKVVSVEPATSNCLQAALVAGEPTTVTVAGLASDSLGARRIGDVPWSIVRRYVDAAVLVADDEIRAAQRALWQQFRLVAEPGGAAALAALRCGAYVPEAGERVVVVVCGSNCDPTTVT